MAYKGFDLTGKVSLVTGGNGGIGLGMADAMAEAGADVCIWGTNPAKNSAAAEKLKRHGHKVHTQIVDVGDEKQVEAGFAETLKVMGHVDNCVANARDGVAVADQYEIEIKALEDAEIVLVETDRLN